MEALRGRHDCRDRSGRFRRCHQEPERKERSFRRRGNRESGLPDGGGAGSRRKQNHHPQVEITMIKEVAFVAIAVSDAERARKFYQETLELNRRQPPWAARGSNTSSVRRQLAS